MNYESAVFAVVPNIYLNFFFFFLYQKKLFLHKDIHLFPGAVDSIWAKNRAKVPAQLKLFTIIIITVCSSLHHMCVSVRNVYPQQQHRRSKY